LLQACSPLRVINGLVPSDTHTVLAAQRYGAGERQLLDVYLPLAQPARTAVLFFMAVAGAAATGPITRSWVRRWPPKAS